MAETRSREEDSGYLSEGGDVIASRGGRRGNLKGGNEGWGRTILQWLRVFLVKLQVTICALPNRIITADAASPKSYLPRFHVLLQLFREYWHPVQDFSYSLRTARGTFMRFTEIQFCDQYFLLQLIRMQIGLKRFQNELPVAF